jgi:hypothetical protein
VTNPPSLEPTFSFAELARSWAEVTGDTPENILYRLGDWAVTDAFPDDAFLTGAAGAATFENVGIFQRMLWHQKLSEKISKERDPKERERLRKRADYHMQIAESAVLRRDLIINACRAMNVDPPPILGLVKGSAAHAVPPELASDTLVRVGRDRQPARRRDIMAPDEAKRYTPLWDAAAIRSRSNGHSVDWNWLRLMDRFWTGELSPTGLVYFFPGRPGREFVVFEREALARLLLGWRASDRMVPMETLCDWTITDYLRQPDPFCDYFRRDPDGRVGLAAQTNELVHRRAGAISVVTGTSGPTELRRQRRKRGGYIGALEQFIARIKPAEFDKMSDHAVRVRFENGCQDLEAAGKSAPSLPRDRRNVERQISKIRERISELTAKNVGSNAQ